MKSKWTNVVLGSTELQNTAYQVFIQKLCSQYLIIHIPSKVSKRQDSKGQNFLQYFGHPLTKLKYNSIYSSLLLCIFQGQPYSFWVSAFTLAGEGQVSEIVAETPQVSIPAGIASFSQKVIHAVKESVEMSCIMVGIPYPTLSWTKK